MNNKFWPLMHVRDIADALLLVCEKAGPSERFICALEQMDITDIVALLKSKFPSYDYVDK
jgi:nucleoside-diphosphate-sugar epimerase